MRALHLLAGSVFAAGVVVSQPGLAQSKKEPTSAEVALAKDMLKDAIAEEKAGKYADALSMLKQVAAIKESGEVLLHIGDCQMKLGDSAEALKTYEHADEIARADKDKATQQALVSRLNDLRDKIPSVALILPDETRDAKVTIDGEVVEEDRLEKPIPLAAGEHTIEVTREGHRPFTKKITLADKDHAEVKVELPRLAAGEAPVTQPDPTPEPDKKGSPEIPLATWIAGSAALVLTVGGIIAFVAAGSEASDGKDQCAKQTKCDESAISSVHTLDGAALGMWIGAGIGAGVAVTFFVLSRNSPKKDVPAASGARTSPAARVMLGPGSVRLVGTF